MIGIIGANGSQQASGGVRGDASLRLAVRVPGGSGEVLEALFRSVWKGVGAVSGPLADGMSGVGWIWGCYGLSIPITHYCIVG